MGIWRAAARGDCRQSASRRELLRNGLVHVRDMTDSETKPLARSLKAGDSAQAFDVLRAISLGVPPPKPAALQSLGHVNASYWWRASQPNAQTFDYTDAQHIAAATFRAAHFQAPPVRFP